ncbi:hypothetical protein P3S68_010730 [Capsicum galapagoense]
MATSSAYLCCPVTSATGKKCVFPNGSTGFLVFGGRRLSNRLVTPKSVIRADLDSMVSDMSTNAPKGLFPPEPEHYRGPKLKVAIIGAVLAGMSTAVKLLDQGHEVDIYESTTFIGGKEGPQTPHSGNTLGLLLLLLLCRRVLKNLLVKEHTHTFVNKGGEIGELDFRFPVGAPLRGINAFLSTNQLKIYDKARNAVALALIPVVRALVDPDGGALQQIRDLDSVPSKVGMQRGTLRENTRVRGTLRENTRSCDVPGIKRLVPQKWRELVFFDNIYKLVGVPVVTVQLRYDGWVSELQDLERSRQSKCATGLDNLLYTPDADFSCFGDLALTSPEDYYIEG